MSDQWDSHTYSLAHDDNSVVAGAHLDLEERVYHLQDGVRGRELAPCWPFGVVELGHSHSIWRALKEDIHAPLSRGHIGASLPSFGLKLYVLLSRARNVAANQSCPSSQLQVQLITVIL